jgi:hypothetical protein
MATPSGRSRSQAGSGKAKKARARRHEAAMVAALKGITDISPSITESMLGLARTWDLIEASGKNLHSVPAIAKEIRAHWDMIGVQREEEDLWQEIDDSPAE